MEEVEVHNGGKIKRCSSFGRLKTVQQRDEEDLSGSLPQVSVLSGWWDDDFMPTPARQSIVCMGTGAKGYSISPSSHW